MRKIISRLGNIMRGAFEVVLALVLWAVIIIGFYGFILPAVSNILNNIDWNSILGTSNLEKDSDNDGIPDQYDAHPFGGGRYITKHFEWTYGKYKFTWTVSVHSDVFHYYEIKPRPTWRGDYNYYAEFIEFEDKELRKLAQGLKEWAKRNGFNYYDSVMFTVSFVQSLPYTSDKFTGFDEYTKYPIQTIIDQSGDCEDLSILAAALLKRQGYDVKLFYVKPKNDSNSNHMAIGVLGDYYYSGTYIEKDGKKYFYVETTSPGWKFGQMPEKFKKAEIISIDLN